MGWEPRGPAGAAGFLPRQERSLPNLAELPVLTSAQERILGIVRARPGLTIREMAREVGVSHATMTYHLGLLVRKRMVVRERDGREVRHFPLGVDRKPLAVVALCRDPRKRQLFDLLALQPEAMSIHRVANLLGMPFGYVKRTLIQFEREGLARLHRARLRYMVEAGPELRRIALQVPQVAAASAPASPPAPAPVVQVLEKA